MSNAFNTDTAVDLDTYLANTPNETFEDILGAWRVAGRVKGQGESALQRVLLNAMDQVTLGKIVYVAPQKGAKKATAGTTHAEQLAHAFVDSGASTVTKGSGSYRNMLSTINTVIGYAAMGETRAPKACVEKALKYYGDAKAAEGKPALGGVKVMERVAKAARSKDWINKNEPLPDTVLQNCAVPPKSDTPDFDKRVNKIYETLNADGSGAPTGNELWDAVMTAMRAYLDSVEAEETAETAIQQFADKTVLEALVKSGLAKVNKSGSVTIKLPA